jgi:RNA polymerase sigma-70 factor, ECF subfamily
MTSSLAYAPPQELDPVDESDPQRTIDSKRRDRESGARALRGKPPVDLIVRARRGDDAALEQLIRGYQRRVGRMVVALIGDDADWPDLCQQIFVKMVHGLTHLKSVELFEPWLFRIVRNACYDHLRHRRSQRFLVRWEPWHNDVPADAPSAHREAASVELANAIAQLPDDQRELITLLRDRQWSYESLARMTGDSLAAIKSRLFRARRRLRNLMAGAESEP